MSDDAHFDANALMQWATDGGFVPADPHDQDRPETRELFEWETENRKPQCSAPPVVGSLKMTGWNCPSHDFTTTPNLPRTSMSQQAELLTKEITVHAFCTEAQCEYSGKTGEAVEISTADGSIQHAVICMAELTKLLRFRHRQHDKQNGKNGAGLTA